VQPGALLFGQPYRVSLAHCWPPATRPHAMGIRRFRRYLAGPGIGASTAVSYLVGEGITEALKWRLRRPFNALAP
jgi:hypothetical protein